jgi:hypothetical protein
VRQQRLPIIYKDEPIDCDLIAEAQPLTLYQPAERLTYRV